MKLSICIVNYNSGKLLKACLDSLARYPPACAYEIIVVDNGSTDGSARVVNGAPRGTLIQNASNVGFRPNEASILNLGRQVMTSRTRSFDGNEASLSTVSVFSNFGNPSAIR